MKQEKANEIRIEVLKSSIGGYKPDSVIPLLVQNKTIHKKHADEIQKLIDLATEVISFRDASLEKANNIKCEEDILSTNDDFKKLSNKYIEYLEQFDKVNELIMKK